MAEKSTFGSRGGQVIDDVLRNAIKNTARMLTGADKRAFMASVANELLAGSPRKAEREFGWNRETVKKGIREAATNIRCIDNYAARGNRRTEEKYPELAVHLRLLFDHRSQIKREFRKYFPYGKVTGKGARQALLDHFDYREEDLPSDNTIANMLTRLGYRIVGSVQVRALRQIAESLEGDPGAAELLRRFMNQATTPHSS